MKNLHQNQTQGCETQAFKPTRPNQKSTILVLSKQNPPDRNSSPKTNTDRRKMRLETNLNLQPKQTKTTAKTESTTKHLISIGQTESPSHPAQRIPEPFVKHTWI